MSTETSQKKSKNLLSIDGGTNALTALSIFGELASRRQFDLKSEKEVLLADQFDMIMATGPGALVAILIGTLRLPISQAMEAYAKISTTIPATPAKDDEERRKNTELFEQVFGQVLEEANFPNFPKDRVMLDNAEPKIIICTSNTVDIATLYPIRSYRARRGHQPPCTIVQAALASIAYPDRFLPITLGSGDQRVVLIDATLGYANPTKELLRQAQEVFGGDTETATIVSIGSGKVEVGINAVAKNGLSNSEQVHKEMQFRLQETNIYHRFNAENDLGGEARVAYTRITSYLHDELVTQRLDEVLKSLNGRPTGPTLKDINSVRVLQIALPPRPPVVSNFIGREDILEAMHRTHITERSSGLQKPPTTVLYGIGGSGKTQTALKFALDFENSHPDVLIFFLNASSEDSLKAGLRTLIRSRGAVYRTKSFQDALEYLAKEVKNWMMIMDNADNPSVRLFPFIPKCAHGNVIITTRNSNHRTLALNSHHLLEGLSTNEAIDLLLTLSNNPRTEESVRLADDIVQALGHLPLAITHAGAYILLHECLSTYLQMYNRSKMTLLSSSPSYELPADYSLTVAATVQMSLAQLPQTALNLMQVFSHLDCMSIAHEIIVRAATRNFIEVVKTSQEDLNPLTLQHATALRPIFTPSDDWLEAEFNLILTKCLQYSLLRLTRGEETKFYSMHLLVQSYVQDGNGSVQNYPPRHLIPRLLGSSITYDPNNRHIGFNLHLVHHIRLVHLQDVVEGGDCFGFGAVFLEAGDSKKASIYWERCVELWTESLGEEHKNTLAAMINLANSYGKSGDTTRALELEETVLEVQRAVYGTEDRDTLNTMNNLGASYYSAGQYDKALALHEEVVQFQARILRPEDPQTLTAMSNVANDYRQADRYQEALDIETQIIKIQTRVLKPEDPAILMTMNNIAASYGALGKYGEAIDILGKVLEIRKRVLGPEHPETMRSTSKLSILYIAAKQYEQSLAQNKPVLDWQKKILGLEHPDTLFTIRNRIRALTLLQRMRELVEEVPDAVVGHENGLGMEHPETITFKEFTKPICDIIETYGREALLACYS